MTYYQYKHRTGITWAEYISNRIKVQHGIYELDSGGYVAYIVVDGNERRVGFSSSKGGAMALAKSEADRSSRNG